MFPFVEELIPCPDPWEVARKFSHLPYLLFLDSSERHPERGRYSYVMADPVSFATNGVDLPSGFAFGQHYSSTSNIPHSEWLPPFRGGLAGLLGYDFNRQLENIPEPRLNDFHTGHLAVGQYEWVVSFDHSREKAWIICKPGANRTHGQIRTWINRDVPCSHSPEPRGPSEVKSNFTKPDYLAAVRRVIDYIRAGDVYQVNLAQRLLAPLSEHPLDLYGRLRRVSPAPFSCYFDAGGFQVVSASPERFLKVDADRTISTKPVKGTRPRGKTPDKDTALLHDLRTSEKDRAENVMIVDLLRNDIGKVAEYGSVHVPKVCEVETYNYVHHLVSEVRGKLRQDRTPFDLLKAAFPGGSVTGAPKVRAMEIIAELEPTARGPYCGSIGFIGFDGVMDMNILIRTFTACQGWLQFPVGGGIVADSLPEDEYEETITKAQGLLKALKPTMAS